MSSALKLRGPEGVVVGRDRAEAREQEVGAGQQQRQRVRRAPDVGEADISVSLPVHDSRSCSITSRFSAITSRMPSGTLAVTETPSMPPFCTPCAPAARVTAMQRASRYSIELPSVVAHQALGARARGEAHLEAARGVAGGQEGLRPGRVVAVDEDLLGAVDRDRLGVRRQAAHAELELGALLDRALRQRARGRDLRRRRAARAR